MWSLHQTDLSSTNVSGTSRPSSQCSSPSVARTVPRRYHRHLLHHLDQRQYDEFSSFYSTVFRAAEHSSGAQREEQTIVNRTLRTKRNCMISFFNLSKTSSRLFHFCSRIYHHSHKISTISSTTTVIILVRAMRLNNMSMCNASLSIAFVCLFPSFNYSNKTKW